MPFAIFDIETRIDKRLVNETQFRGRSLSDEAAFATLRRELVEQRGSDFFPLSFHVPVAIAVGSVSSDYLLQSVESLAEGDYSEERLVREFWERVEKFRGCLVTFNGRQFDFPVLELHEFITNFGAYRVRGGFDLLLRTIGLPGKGKVDGSQVQELWDAGRLAEIHEYCRRDVIQTYYLFLRVEVVRGRLTAERYRQLLDHTLQFRLTLEQGGGS